MGLTLVKRKVRVSDLVGTYAREGARSGHANELGKADFRQMLRTLNVLKRQQQQQQQQQPPPPSPGSPGADGGSGGGLSGSGIMLTTPRRATSGRASSSPFGSPSGAATTPRATPRATPRDTPRGTPGSARGAAEGAWRREVDALFDELDGDRSGWIDHKEATTALSTLADGAAEAMTRRDKMARQAADMRRRAERLTKRAMKFATGAPSADDSATGGGLSAAIGGANGVDGALAGAGAGAAGAHGGGVLSLDVRGRPRLPLGGDTHRRGSSLMLGGLQLFSSRHDPSNGSGSKHHTEAELKKRAKQSLARLGQLHTARGWAAWRSCHEERQYALGLLARAAGRMAHRTLARAFARYVEYHSECYEGMRRRSVIEIGLRRLAQADVLRGFVSWLDGAADRHEGKRLMAVASRSAARLHQPRLVRAWEDWRAEARLCRTLRYGGGDDGGERDHIHHAPAAAARAPVALDALCGALQRCVMRVLTS